MQSSYLEVRNLEFFNANVEGYWSDSYVSDNIVDYTIILNQSTIQDHKIILGENSNIVEHRMKF